MTIRACYRYVWNKWNKKVLLIKSFKTNQNNLGGKIYATDININSPALFFADDYF